MSSPAESPSAESPSSESRSRIKPLLRIAAHFIEDRPAIARTLLSVMRTASRIPLLGPWMYHPIGVVSLSVGRLDDAVEALESTLERRRAWNNVADQHLARARLQAAMTRLGLSGKPDAGSRRRFEKDSERDRRRDQLLDLVIEAASRAPRDAGLAGVPLPWYLLTPDLCTDARVDSFREIADRYREDPRPQAFLSRMLSYRGDYAEATQLARRTIAATSLPDNAGDEPTRDPAFIIVGQAKAGTTSLFTYLCRHPSVLAPVFKEPNYFSEFPDAGRAWYASHFPGRDATSTDITGEASTTYFDCPAAPGRIATELPGTRIIILLRNPVERAYSSFQMFSRLGIENRSFASAIESELHAIGDCPLNEEHLACAEGLPLDRRRHLLPGAAFPYLLRWLEAIPVERMLLIHFADLAGNTESVMRRVETFLGLPHYRHDRFEPVNRGRYDAMDPQIERRLRNWYGENNEALGKLLAELIPKGAFGYDVIHHRIH